MRVSALRIERQEFSENSSRCRAIFSRRRGLSFEILWYLRMSLPGKGCFAGIVASFSSKLRAALKSVPVVNRAARRKSSAGAVLSRGLIRVPARE